MFVVFTNDQGGVAISKAVGDPVLYGRAIVPAGRPFGVVTQEDLPESRAQRDAWFVDAADLTAGIGERA